MRNLLTDPKLVAEPGRRHIVADFNPAYTEDIDEKEEGQRLLQENVNFLKEYQEKLYAHNRYSVLIIFQALDAAGKDGTIKHVMSGLNPQGCQVHSFKAPSTNELDHDYMWRTNIALPARGMIGIFNRSYYEEVLVVKVHPEFLISQNIPGVKSQDTIKESFWEKRYRQINDLERYLTDNGMIVLKFFLNISKEEQKKRFLDRIENPAKNWKFSSDDVNERRYWDDYMKAYSDMLTATSTKYAPWYVIPADKKWFMRYAVSNIIINRLHDLELEFPTLPRSERDKLDKAKHQLENEE